MTLVITNGTFIDGNGRDPLVGSLVVEGGRITALGRNDQLRIPRDATVLDAMEGSILPGLIDCHVHFLLEYPDISVDCLPRHHWAYCKPYHGCARRWKPASRRFATRQAPPLV